MTNEEYLRIIFKKEETPKEYLSKVSSIGKQYLSTIGEILYTIRGDWGSNTKSRIACCLTLINMYIENCLLGKTDQFIDELENTIKSYEQGDDGRYFRDNFPYGYIGIRFSDFGDLEDE